MPPRLGSWLHSTTCASPPWALLLCPCKPLHPRPNARFARALRFVLRASPSPKSRPSWPTTRLDTTLFPIPSLAISSTMDSPSTCMLNSAGFLWTRLWSSPARPLPTMMTTTPTHLWSTSPRFLTKPLTLRTTLGKRIHQSNVVLVVVVGSTPLPPLTTPRPCNSSSRWFVAEALANLRALANSLPPLNLFINKISFCSKHGHSSHLLSLSRCSWTSTQRVAGR